jgi:transposase
MLSKPRDKAKVEVGVQVVQRWILARLRNRRFFSLAELNRAIRELADNLNDRPMRGWGTTRRALFEQLDRPAPQSLPPTPYEYADWKRCRVNLDYHIEIAKHFYSVPFRLLRQEVEARITAKTVEIFHRGNLVATHLRSLRPYRPTTVVEHMPSSHRRYRDWTHERIQREAAAIGSDTAALVEIVLRSRPHPEQGFRSCIGILGLCKRYSAERLDAACGQNARTTQKVQMRPSKTWGWSGCSLKRGAGPTFGHGTIPVERAVHDGGPNFQHQMSAPRRPAHLLLGIHSPMQQPLHRALGDRRRNRFFKSAGRRVGDDDVGLSGHIRICL